MNDHREALLEASVRKMNELSREIFDKDAEIATLRVENRVLKMKCESMEGMLKPKHDANYVNEYMCHTLDISDTAKMNDKIVKLETHIKQEIYNLDAIEKALTQLLCRLDDKLTKNEEYHLRILISSLGEMIERSNRV